MAGDCAELTRQLIRVGQRFDARGWVLGTSGNFSAVVEDRPLRLAITRSGAHKGELTPDDILEIDEHGSSVDGRGAPSAETGLHLDIVRGRLAAAVLHTHSIWSTLVSDRCAGAGGVAIEGYEMLKGLARVRTHAHREWIPVLDNDQDMPRLAARMRAVLREHPDCHAFLLRRHGLYTWGGTLPEAVRHVEIMEFLLESVGRAEYGRYDPRGSEEVAPWRS
jgi:methylthioribulose-1-phosphate dehydratase